MSVKYILILFLLSLSKVAWSETSTWLEIEEMLTRLAADPKVTIDEIERLDSVVLHKELPVEDQLKVLEAMQKLSFPGDEAVQKHLIHMIHLALDKTQDERVRNEAWRKILFNKSPGDEALLLLIGESLKDPNLKKTLREMSLDVPLDIIDTRILHAIRAPKWAQFRMLFSSCVKPLSGFLE